MQLYKFLIVFSFSFGLFINQSIGQEISQLIELKSNFDRKYGLDSKLYCGVKYFPEHTKSKGIPFYKREYSFIGDLTYNGKKYKKLNILYDIYKQNIILEYKNINENINRIVLNDYYIDSINIDNKTFIKNIFPDIEEKYLEVLIKDSISCYISRKKLYVFDNSLTYADYIYSNEIKVYYLVYNDNVYKFSDRRDFLAIFPKGQRKRIKKYVRGNGIKIRRDNDKQIFKLVMFCNSL